MKPALLHKPGYQMNDLLQNPKKQLLLESMGLQPVIYIIPVHETSLIT